MKQFLYLLQSRIKCLEDHKILESDNSDYIVATFEKKIDRKNFIYVPNTIWTEGRNALYEEAMKRKDQYEYFVFLDDDMVFERGSFRVFEKEVLHIQADCAVPPIMCHPFHKMYDRYNPFQYSNISFIDQIMVCLSRELFCSPKLLPYDMDYVGKHHLGGGVIAPSDTFFMKLYEHFGDRLCVMTNNVVVTNNYHDTEHDLPLNTLEEKINWYYYPALKKHHALKYPGYRDHIRKKVPGMIYRQHEDTLIHLLEKLRLRTSSKLGITIILYKTSYIYLALLERYIFIISFIRDFKLNFRLRKDQ